MANKTFEVDIGGKTYEVDAPDAQTAWAWANQSVAQQQKPVERIDPTEGMSGTEKFLAGAGKAFYDLGRGAGQRLRDVLPEKLSDKMGLPTEADVEAARRRDEALMNTGAGIAGNFTGNVAATAPAMFVPGANTLAGGTALGAALGYLQPTGKGESTISNSVLGGMAGGAIPAVMGAGRALKAGVYDPIAGQNRIIGGALTRAVGEDNAPAVAQALRGRGAQTKGVTLSAGTVSENEALSALEDAIQSQLPRSELSRTAQVNRSALASALRDIGQDETALVAAKDARNSAADVLYGKAFQSDAMRRDLAKEANAANSWVGSLGNAQAQELTTPGLQLLMQRPTFKKATTYARQLMADQGIQISKTSGAPQTLQELHYIKLALDKMKNPNAATSAERVANASINDISEALAKELVNVSPTYGAARETFTQMSRPVNQIQIGQKLYNTLVPATAGENPASLNYKAFAQVLRNPDVVAQQATKFKGSTMSGAMEPQQLSVIQGVASDASRISEALKRGAGTGSPTARRLAQANMVSEHFAEKAPFIASVIDKASQIPGVNMLAKGISTAGSFVGGNRINQNMVGKLDEMLATNPQQVAALIEQELKFLKPSERSQALRMLPQTLMLSLPSMQGAQ